HFGRASIEEQRDDAQKDQGGGEPIPPVRERVVRQMRTLEPPSWNRVQELAHGEIFTLEHGRQFGVRGHRANDALLEVALPRELKSEGKQRETERAVGIAAERASAHGGKPPTVAKADGVPSAQSRAKRCTSVVGGRRH